MKASDLIGLAKTQLGYIGKRHLTDDLDAYEAPNGRGDFTKYARDMYIAGFYNGNKQGVDGWCTIGVDWCFYQAAGSKEKADEVNPIGSCGAGADWAYRDYLNAGLIVKEPKIGDRVFFFDSYGKCYHVGLVSNVGQNGAVETIEFNGPNDVVYSRTKNYNTDRLKFGRPRYETEEEEDIPDLKVGDLVRLKEGALVYGQSYPFADFVYDSILYVRGIDGDKVWISIVPEGAITGIAYAQDLEPVEPESNTIEVDRETLEDILNRVTSIKMDLEKILK